jgi:PAS domain S-box-containing protein
MEANINPLPSERDLETNSLLDMLIERMPMGAAILDPVLTVRRYNTMWVEFVERCLNIPPSQVAPGINFFDLVHGNEAVFSPLLERVLTGETVRLDALRSESEATVSYWEVILIPLLESSTLKGVVNITADATQRVMTYQFMQESEEQYRSIFEASTDGLLILDLNGTVVDANPAACRMHGYTYAELIGLSPKTFVHPEYHYLADKLMATVQAGEQFRGRAVNLRKDGSTLHVELLGTTCTYMGRPHLLAVVRDISEQVEAYQTLEMHVEERTHELYTLLEVVHSLTTTLELRPLLRLILNQLRKVVDYSGAAIFTLEGQELVILDYQGPISQEEALKLHFPLNEAGVNTEVIRRRIPVIIPDVRADTPLARAFRESAGEKLETIFSYIGSWMGIPLIVRERAVGMLSLDHSESNYYSSRHARLALAFANQAAVAIENARLYHEEQERRHEAEQRRRVAEGLGDILTIINSNRSLDEILDYLVTRIGLMLGADGVAVFCLRSKDGPLTVQAAQGLPADFVSQISLPVGQGAVGWSLLTRKPVFVPDVHDFPAQFRPQLEPPQQELLTRLSERCRAVLAVPIIVKNEPYGSIALYYTGSQELSEESISLAAAFADQAALAIENARLRTQAEQAAAAAERSRLARDLHDAVTQTLFSASLIAEVLPRLWERDAEEGRRRLEELRQLTRGALAEMRTLLLELRPAALTEVSLGDLLRQLAEAVTGRARIPITLAVDGQCPLPPDVQIALYRIAQEALNNVAKHAGASQATVDLNCNEDGIKLRIRDNGRGFDLSLVSPTSLGLGIMRERAESVGAILAIDSQIGKGTEVTVIWVRPKEVAIHD